MRRTMGAPPRAGRALRGAPGHTVATAGSRARGEPGSIAVKAPDDHRRGPSLRGLDAVSASYKWITCHMTPISVSWLTGERPVERPAVCRPLGSRSSLQRTRTKPLDCPTFTPQRPAPIQQAVIWRAKATAPRTACLAGSSRREPTTWLHLQPNRGRGALEGRQGAARTPNARRALRCAAQHRPPPA